MQKHAEMPKQYVIELLHGLHELKSFLRSTKADHHLSSLYTYKVILRDIASGSSSACQTQTLWRNCLVILSSEVVQLLKQLAPKAFGKMLLRIPALAAEDSCIQDEALLLLAMLLIDFRPRGTELKQTYVMSQRVT